MVFVGSRDRGGKHMAMARGAAAEDHPRMDRHGKRRLAHPLEDRRGKPYPLERRSGSNRTHLHDFPHFE